MTTKTRIKYHRSMAPLVEVMRRERNAWKEMHRFNGTGLEHADNVHHDQYLEMKARWEAVVRERHQVEAEILRQADWKDS